jgi:hypothetical protein
MKRKNRIIKAQATIVITVMQDNTVIVISNNSGDDAAALLADSGARLISHALRDVVRKAEKKS